MYAYTYYIKSDAAERANTKFADSQRPQTGGGGRKIDSAPPPPPGAQRRPGPHNISRSGREAVIMASAKTSPWYNTLHLITTVCVFGI